jgi:hypothetical protein
MEALLNPAVLTALTAMLALFGTGFGWLWTRISAAKQKHREEIDKVTASHRQCEIELATQRAEMGAMRSKLGEVQGTCSTLTKLLGKELNFGSKS